MKKSNKPTEIIEKHALYKNNRLKKTVKVSFMPILLPPK
jgi:hypothetical protein